MPKIDLDKVPVLTGAGYPAPYAGAVSGRSRKRIGDAGGLSQYGVNICALKPGAASSQRHWRRNEDEFVYILSGEETVFLEVGTRAPSETVEYTDPNVDMKAVKDGAGWRSLHKDGRAW